MTLWDRLRPAQSEPIVAKVTLIADGASLELEWSDAVKTHAVARALRLACPCAACVDEVTGERRIRDEDVPPNIRVEQVAAVGRYALSLAFSDGHRSGIYDWKLLRRVGGG